ncbi:class I SAM-dependent methyltransferase [Fusibacillus kribbianus]|uniref:Class I SAM-dependent methyltransferase n=1 Tax=Fusibacillus kribbianus TaxID=3044208 RepID=A0AAP4EZ92_9FIRM|nr:class I SAM-dependent methyltransferase [Ruminococcus sp. YH-rum2234]MDI9241645.1 class I SAM-dependent methyltransferase [Ruminococcus sp. YH-rum2234]
MATQKEINERWSERAENYSDIINQELKSFRPDRWREKILKNAPAGGQLKILDAGCGPGFFSILLSAEGHEVVGVDGAEAMLSEAIEKAECFGVKPVFLNMDCHHLDFPDNTFDLVVSRNVTHTLREHKTVYGEWLRVLKPGGVLLIFDANWHLVKVDEALREDSMRRYRECVERYGDAFDKKTKNKKERRKQDMEGSHVLGDKRRPDWDMGLLEGLGYWNISAERSIIEEMWDEKEILLYGNTPMFMIRAEKPKSIRGMGIEGR